MSGRIPWDEDLVFKLKHLWPLLSASDVAVRLGYPGARMAVIGKAKRLGLTKATVKAAKPRPRRGKPYVPVTKAAIEQEDRPEPALPVTVIEAHFGHCRWPVSSAPWRFCGARTVPGTSWCERHRRMVYQRAQP